MSVAIIERKTQCINGTGSRVVNDSCSYAED